MNRLFTTASILFFAAGFSLAEPLTEHPTGSRTTPPTIESLARRAASPKARRRC